LSLSPSHVEKYLTAAEGALSEALPAKAAMSATQHWGAFDLRGSSKKDLTPEQMAKVRVDVWPGSTFAGQPGSVRGLTLPAAGEYKVRVKLSGLKPRNGRAPHVVIYAADLDRMLLDQDVV